MSNHINQSKEQLIRRITELMERADKERLEIILLLVERYIGGGR